MHCKRTAARLRPGRIGVSTLASLALLLAGWSNSARADNIDKALLTEGSKVMDYLKKHGYKNVGVLPFRVAQRGKTPHFNVGDLNANMAVRLENTLVLLDDPRKPIGILHKAGVVAARGRKRSYAGPKQRSALFAGDYQLPWGDSKVKADVFLTGDVRFAGNNHSAIVMIKAFDRRAKEPVIVHQFTVRTDRSMLADSGQSFRVISRGKHRRDADDDELAADNATDQEKGGDAGGDNPSPSANGSSDGSVQVALSVLYDGSAVAMDADPTNRGVRRVRLAKRRDGTSPATISGPQANQAVVLVLENNSPTDAYAVVLKVNGKNTLYQETEDALHCSKWVLDPAKDGKPTRYEIKGYYLKDAQDGKNLLPFHVLSEDESKQKEQNFDLPDQLGLIEMHVFKKGAGSGDAAKKVTLRGLSPREHQKAKSRSLAEYQRHLQEKTHVHARGHVLTHSTHGKSAKNRARHSRLSRGGSLIDVNDEAVTGDSLEKTDFDSPSEVSSRIYRYYTPGGGGKDDSSGPTDK